MMNERKTTYNALNMRGLKTCIILSVLALTLPMSVKAERITSQQALQRARQFLSTKTGCDDVLKNAPLQRAVRRGAQADTDALYYVFTAPQQGFVIASASDRTQPVLGYSTDGTLDLDNLPEHIQMWLDSYAEQIDWLEQHPEASPVQVTVSGSAIAPMLKTEWGQREPYNLLCPVHPSTNEHCLTGCMSTCMAQVMYYHQWPKQLPVDIPAYETSSAYVSGMPFAAGTTIDWEHMLPTYTAIGPTDTENMAVAQLMAMCGTALKTRYSSYDGSAGLFDLRDAFRYYFDYDPGVCVASREDYKLAEWSQMMYDELQAGRVVPYMGVNIVRETSHALVLDGYDGDGYFHFNCGWEGGSNGYFLLSMLDYAYGYGVPYMKGPLGYSVNQWAVLGIQKNTGVMPEAWNTLRTTFINLYMNGKSLYETQVTRNSTADDFQFTVSSSWWGYDLDAPQYFDLSFGVFTPDGAMVGLACDVIKVNTDIIAEQQGIVDLLFGSGIESGTYIVKPVSRVTGTETWHANHWTDKYYIIATIDGNTMTLVCMPYNLPPAVLDVSGTIAVETERPMVGEYCDAKCTVTNNGTDFNNYIYLLIDGELKEARLVDIDAGQTSEFPFRFYPPSEPGTHTVSLAHNRKRIGNTYDFEYTILATCQIEVFKPIDGELKIAIESPDIVNGIISSDKIKVKLTFVNCLETDYDNKIKLEVMHRLSDGEEDHNYELWKTVDVSTPIPALGTVVKEVVVDGFVDGYYYINPYYKIDAYRWMFARQPDNYSYHYLSIDFTVILPQATTVTLDLKKGWNWVAPVISEDCSISAADYVAAIGTSSVACLRSRTQELRNDDTKGLVGNLTALLPNEGYKLLMRKDSKVVRQGVSLPVTTFIGVTKDEWRWIGYTPRVPLPINVALENRGNTGNRVVGRDSFAYRYNYSWHPEDFIMKPGEAYMYYATVWDRNFMYPIDYDESAAGISDGGTSQPIQTSWQYDVYAYPDNLTMICQLDPQQTLISEQEPLVGAFVGNECRGIGRWVEGYLFLTVHGTFGQGETVSLQALDAATGTIQPVRETFAYDADFYGGMEEPVILHFGADDSSVSPIHTDATATQRIFSVSGVPQRQLHPGVNIIMRPDGTYVKRWLSKYQ